MWNERGEVINLKEYGLNGLSLIPESPSYVDEIEEVEGMDGALGLDRKLNPRNIEAKFLANAYDYDDSLLLRDSLYSLFSSRESFYIGEVRQPGKNWFVQNNEVWKPERINHDTYEINLNLTCLKGVAESVYTTLTPFEWDVDAWQFGMGIPYDEYNYVHTTSEFEIYNAGKAINPRTTQMYLKIKIDAKTSSFIELINKTTNEIYRYNGSLNSGQELVIEGIRSTKSGLSVFRDTNKRLISLDHGPNEIEVRGPSSINSIEFDFKFYYD